MQGLFSKDCTCRWRGVSIRRSGRRRIIRLVRGSLVRGRGLCLGALALAAASLPLCAQGLPSEPLVFGDGRVAISGGASITVSCAGSVAKGCGEDAGFFNYSDYEHSTLRMMRLTANAAVRANGYVSFLTEVRSENGDPPVPYALYVRVRPWRSRAIDVQAGRIPPVFGAFARRDYASDNILIGYPLAYQYLSSLRTDAVPANADELLRMRGRGWLANYSIGNTAPAHGLPLVTAFRWDTGAEVHGASSWADASIAVTTGSLGNPRVGDDNGGKQVAGRLAVHPRPGLVAGVSASRAAFLSDTALRAADVPPGGRYLQTAFGVDGEYSWDHYLLRVEAIRSRWQLPTIEPALSAFSTSVEGRYRFRPGWDVAARFDRLLFSELAGSVRTINWDAPVSRLEVGGGYMLLRNLQIKLSLQRNVRDGGRVARETLGAAQAVVWF
jgi:hypothetical protein